ESNIDNFEEEVQNIVETINLIGSRKGVANHLIKNHEGSPGDGIIALFDDPDRSLRLYCIQFGNSILILGNGGYKPKAIRAWQEDPELSKCVNKLKEISTLITSKIHDREIVISDDCMSLTGDLLL